jgi:succinate-semialdehyde dehydrogenase/glutarate-semialdehyde dehydrogenase
MNLNDDALFRQQCYVDGGWVGSQHTIDVTNPASGARLGTVPALGARETEAAVAAAHAAFTT